MCLTMGGRGGAGLLTGGGGRGPLLGRSLGRAGFRLAGGGGGGAGLLLLLGCGGGEVGVRGDLAHGYKELTEAH